LSIQTLEDSDALLLYTVGPVPVCSPTRRVEAVVIPPELTSPPGSDRAEPGIFKSIHGMVRVIDLRVRFGVDKDSFNHPGRIIIVEIEDARVGFWVDEIEDVVSFPQTGWKNVPAHIPREVFSRTLLENDVIRLYADFEGLDRFKATGYLRKHIEQLTALEKKHEDKAEFDSAGAGISDKRSAGNKRTKTEVDERREGKSKAALTAVKNKDKAARLIENDKLIWQSTDKPVSALKPERGDANKVSVYKLPKIENKNTGTNKPLAVQGREISGGAMADNRAGADERGVKKIISGRAGKEVTGSSGTTKNRLSGKAASTGSSQYHSTGQGGGEADSAQASRTPWRWIISIFFATMVALYLWTQLFNDLAEEKLISDIAESLAGGPDDSATLKQRPDRLTGKHDLDDSIGAEGESVAVIAEKSGEQAIAERRINSVDLDLEAPADRVALSGKIEEKGEVEITGAERPEESEREKIAALEKTQMVSNFSEVEYSGNSPEKLPGEPGKVSLIENTSDITIVINELGGQDEILGDDLIEGTPFVADHEGAVEVKPEETGEERGEMPETDAFAKSGLEQGKKVEENQQKQTEEKRAGKAELKLEESALVSREKINKAHRTRKYIHVVVKGDTLWDIAKRYVNNPWRYPELAKLSKIKNPDLIYPGNKVVVIIHSKRKQKKRK